MRAAPHVILAAVCCAVLLGCSADRARPAPMAPDTDPRLSVQLLSPMVNSTVIAGRRVAVEVLARDLDRLQLTGFGFVARRQQGGALVDSVAEFFTAGRSMARDTFELMIPATYPTNTHVEIHGLAFGPRGISRVSVPVAVTVIQCKPDLPICQ